jgi:2'-5' RNA ligase
MSNQAPRILTLQIQEPAFSYFNNLRKQYFPPQLNYLDAHITLFHHLPATEVITNVLEQVVVQQPLFPVEVTGIMKLGRGVAFQLRSKELVQLQENLKQHWQEWLIPQDRQKFRPHVTVQNKVSATEALMVYEKLISSFQVFCTTGLGLSLWEYLGGPWQKIKDYTFSGSSRE